MELGLSFCHTCVTYSLCDHGDLTSLDISFFLCKNIFKCLSHFFIQQTFIKLLNVSHLHIEYLNPPPLEKGGAGGLPHCAAELELEGESLD